MQINVKILGLSTMIPKSLSEQSIYISSDALEGVQLPAPEKILRAEAYLSEEESGEREGLGGETIYTAFALSSCFLGPSRVQPPTTKEDMSSASQVLFLEIHRPVRAQLQDYAKFYDKTRKGTLPMRLTSACCVTPEGNVEISPLPRLQHLPPPSTPTTTSLVQLFLSSDLAYQGSLMVLPISSPLNLSNPFFTYFRIYIPKVNSSSLPHLVKSFQNSSTT